MTDGWVELAPLVRALRDWLATETERPVGWDAIPAGQPAPYSVLSIVGNPREYLALSAGQSVTLVPQVICVGQDPKGRPSPEQAMLLADRVSKALVGTDGDGAYLRPLSLPGVAVVLRESNGDGRPGDSESVAQWIESYRLLLLASE